MTRFQQFAGWFFVALFIFAVWGSLFASIWFLASPWCYAGAFISAGIYWLLQRDSVFETLVIVVLLLVMIAMLRKPILHLKGYMNNQGGATINMTQQTKGTAG